jgi:nicotinate-nucleotide adenylyltransferase
MTVPIGILGGIFDPVHYGHLATARLAGDYFQFDTVIYIPAGVPPHKTASAASPADRLAMLRLALDGEPGAVIWNEEINSSEVSYTFDTLEILSRQYPGTPLYFIVGADNLHEIHTWHRYREILERVTLCVAERPGFTMTIPETLAGATLKTFPSPQWGLSSTLLRTYLSKGYGCKHLIPGPVRDYILHNGLYRVNPDPAMTVKCHR